MRKKTRFLKALFVMLVIVATLGCMTAFADEVDEAVKDARKGVFQVQLSYEDKEGRQGIIGGGSAFLINEDTILTCYHVVHIDEGSTNYQEAVNMFGEEFDTNYIKINVVVRDDITIQAKIINESAAKDFAILELEQPISNREILPLNSKGNISATQQVYALGFPDVVSSFQNQNTYIYDDVTISDGRVTKTNESDGVKYVQHSANLSSGYSGGPLVTNTGVVVAINRGTLESNNYSVSIDQITDTLDDLGIQYTAASSPVDPDPEETTDKIEPDTTETDSEEITTPEPTMAEKPTTAETESNSEEGIFNQTTIIIIAVAAVVIIIILILIVALGGKKDKKVNTVVQGQLPPQGGYPMGGQQVPEQRMTPPMNNQMRPQSAPMYGGNEGEDATTLLNDGGDATTVLSGASQNSFKTIVRSKTGERIVISRQEFLLGKERRRVDYCISGNNSVSRVHAKLINRSGQLFILDMNATNGTYVNGTKLSSGQETRLSSGDKFKLADEEFQVM